MNIEVVLLPVVASFVTALFLMEVLAVSPGTGQTASKSKRRRRTWSLLVLGLAAFGLDAFVVMQLLPA